MHTVITPVHPEPEFLTFDTVLKARAVESVMLDAIDDGRLAGVELMPGRPADEAELVRVHDPRYVKAVITGDPDDLAASNGIGWDPHLFAIAAGSAGAVRDAALEALSSGGYVGALSAGLHHARRQRGNGYCTFNGLALALRAAEDVGARRVMVLDVDAHCGGGTASFIAGMGRVEQLDLSLYSFDHYESTDRCRLVMVEPENYLSVLDRELTQVTDPEGIDLVIHNAGMDVHEHAGGPKGMTTEVVAVRETMIFEWAKAHGLPVAWTLAGGYTSAGLTLREVAELHLLTPAAAIAATN